MKGINFFNETTCSFYSEYIINGYIMNGYIMNGYN